MPMPSLPEPHRISPREAALMTVLLVRVFQEDRGKATTRARVSLRTLRRLSGRGALRSIFIQEWTEELADLGWHAFPLEEHFAIIKDDAVSTWPSIAARRIEDEIEKAKRGDVKALRALERDLIAEREAEDEADD